MWGSSSLGCGKLTLPEVGQAGMLAGRRAATLTFSARVAQTRPPPAMIRVLMHPMAGDRNLVTYPFATGRSGMEAGKSREQWRLAEVRLLETLLAPDALEAVERV